MHGGSNIIQVNNITHNNKLNLNTNEEDIIENDSNKNEKFIVTCNKLNNNNNTSDNILIYGIDWLMDSNNNISNSKINSNSDYFHIVTCSFYENIIQSWRYNKEIIHNNIFGI